MENDYINKIETLNLEIMELKKSKEYCLGRKIINIKELIKKGRIDVIIKRALNKKNVKKMAKYNAHGELENNFQFDVSLRKKEKPKIVIYTCITGKYDNLKTPFLKFNNIDYVAFTDNEEKKNSVWNVKDIPENIKDLKDNVLINRYIKFHPNELFKDYDYSIYIDGNIKVMSDFTDFIYGINDKTGLAFHRHQFRNCIYDEIEACRLVKKGNYKKMKIQTEMYKSEGFPEKFGLYECGVIVTDLKNNVSLKILDEWWKEFIKSEMRRDQISLPYIVWENGYKFEDIGSLGNNLYKNPKFEVIKHEN